MSSTTNQNNLCDYCHQKPKFGNFQYCGRTCSTQAAATPQQTSPLCKQCQQRPKFQTFEFCGKNCASTWQTNNPGANNNPSKPSKGFGKPSAANPPPAVNMAQPLHPQSLNQIPNPQVIAPVAPVANGPKQHPNIPRVAVPPATMKNSAAPPVAPPAQPQQPQPATGSTQAPNAAVPAPLSTGVCLIQGCGKPVYTAGTSQSSEYCGQRHREEAVTSGLVEGCIMCNKLPRSATDHFCSKACRDTALAP